MDVTKKGIEPSFAELVERENAHVNFCGMVWRLNQNSTQFLRFSEMVTNKLDKYRVNIQEYLDNCNDRGLLVKGNRQSKIMIADDQFVVRQVMDMHLTSLGLKDLVMLCENGEEVVRYF